MTQTITEIQLIWIDPHGHEWSGSEWFADSALNRLKLAVRVEEVNWAFDEAPHRIISREVQVCTRS